MRRLWCGNGSGVLSMSICERCIHNTVCGAEDEDMIQCMFFLKEDEIKPIVHARWIVEFDDRGWKKHSCSGCGYFRRTDIHVSLNWDYCPHCGAKMDLEERLNDFRC